MKVKTDIPQVEDAMFVYVAWTNTDCTEGRGKSVPYAVCTAESTARRLGKERGIQGSDCPVTQEIAVRVKGSLWLAPCEIHYPNDADAREEKRLEAKRQAEQRKHEALERAREAGLSDEDIEILKGES